MAKSSPTILTLYSREGCHLCQDMTHVLQDFSGSYNFTVTVVDIDTDVALYRQFNELVPALYVGNHEICHHFLDLEALVKALPPPADDLYSGSDNALE